MIIMVSFFSQSLYTVSSERNKHIKLIRYENSLEIDEIYCKQQFKDNFPVVIAELSWLSQVSAGNVMNVVTVSVDLAV